MITDLTAEELTTYTLALATSIAHEIDLQHKWNEPYEMTLRNDSRDRQARFQKHYDALMDEIARRIGVEL